jgi:chromosome segregation ATPase
MRVSPALLLGLVVAHRAGENPISKVVHLLQGLQEQVEKEGEEEKGLYAKFMCYCDSNDGQLKSDMQDEQARIDELESEIAQLAASNGQLEADVKDLEEEIAENQKAVASAKQVRAKEASEYDAEAEDLQGSIDALEMAIPAIQQGQSGALAQLSSRLAPRALQSSRDQPLMRALLQESSGERAPSSQILGILQQMEENFKEDRADAKATERAARKTFAELERAKGAELASAMAQRDDKKARVADQKLSLATAQEDLEDTKLGLAKDQEFTADLQKSCKDKTKQWEERQKTRNDEVVAISETIKVLNADDARDLFKSTLPSPETSPPPSFVQTAMHTSATFRLRAKLRARANGLEEVMRTSGADTGMVHQNQMSAVVLAMKTATPDKFASIKTMVNEMVANLEKEQDDDDAHYAYCQDELAAKAAKRAKLNEELDLLDSKLGNLAASIKTTDDEMATLKQEIAKLDTSVADATAARKAEHSEFTATTAELQMAIDLLHKAKDRMAAFYAPKPQPVQQSFLGLGISFVQVRRSASVLDEFLQAATQAQSTSGAAQKAQPPPAPETFGDNYEKKTGKGMGVMALLDNLANDCKAQQQEAKSSEGEAQRNYEALMAESQDAREAKATAIADKETERVRLLEVLGEAKEEKGGDTDELKAVVDNLAALHDSCDFLVQNFDFRKKARSDELDGLKQGLAVLAGASFGAPAAPAFLAAN